jgi:hypothetical protein
VRRGGTGVLPAFARAEIEGAPGIRALTLLPRADGRLGYALVRGDAPTLDDNGLRPTPGQRSELDKVVADLASPRGSDAAEALATRAIRYVALQPGPGSDEVVEALDAQPGLVRRTAGDVDLWRVIAPSYRLSVLPSALATTARSGARAPTQEQLQASPPTALETGVQDASTRVPDGPPGRLLVLADAREGGWHASIDGQVLTPRTAWGWAQAFELPPAGGHLRLTHAHTGRRTALVAELVALLAVLVLAVPAGRRRAGLEDDVDIEDDVHQERRTGVRL